jgi:hypothetical protein
VYNCRCRRARTAVSMFEVGCTNVRSPLHTSARAAPGALGSASAELRGHEVGRVPREAAAGGA